MSEEVTENRKLRREKDTLPAKYVPTMPLKKDLQSCRPNCETAIRESEGKGAACASIKKMGWRKMQQQRSFRKKLKHP